MTEPNLTGHYNINSYWGPRGETAEAVAGRTIKMIKTLTEIDPVFSPWWYYGAEAVAIPFELARSRLPALIAENTDENWGPSEGYRVSGGNSLGNNSRIICMRTRAGNCMPPVGYSNSIQIETVWPFHYPTDASIVTYDIFRAAMVAHR